MNIRYIWRGDFANYEVNQLHAEAFKTRVFSEDEWNWVELTSRHSLGWVIARDHDRLVGFINVISDGLVHAWLQDTLVAISHRHDGIGQHLVAEAAAKAKSAGCEWLHVDFDDDLKPFYLDACGFKSTNAGLIHLAEFNR